MTQVRSYVNDVRTTFQTDWAFAVFVVDSLNDPDGKFANGLSAYAYLNGPFVIMTYDNGGWGFDKMDFVMAHEMGHIFGAQDQYKDLTRGFFTSECSKSSGFLQVPNENQDLWIGNCKSDIDSIMRSSYSAYKGSLIDEYAKGQVGWWDKNPKNGILDPLDRKPPCTDRLERVSESIDPSDVLSPGQAFTKVWRIKNPDTGCTWGPGYHLVPTGGGDAMAAPSRVDLPRNVAPGEEVEISVNLRAPLAGGGTYQSRWQMRNAQGIDFGYPLWVKISVPTGPEPGPSLSGDIEVQSVEYPSVVTPGQRFRPRVTIKVNQGQLLQSRGDLLRNTDGNLYGAWPHVAVVGTVNAGQTYTFEFYENDPITAPSAEGTYQSKWRVWRDGNWAGPEITIRFDVRGSGGTRPNPPTLVSPGNWYVSHDGSTPTLCASAPAGLQYYFQIYESHDIPESGWINNNCWTPPGLGWYGYQWHVKVKDPNTGLESDWSETWHFEISSQDVVTHGPFFSPGSPSAADEVRTWFCVEDQGGVEIYANTATDGSASGEWQWIDPVIGVCNLDENYPDRWPQWHTRAQPDGTHLIRGKAWRGNYGQPGYKERIVETTYTLLRRRPSNVQLINPGQNAWFNTRTITFRWNPEESLRVNTFAFHVSTNPDPVVNPIVNQTFSASTREYTYTFDQDYPSLYWGVQACNELGCSDRAIGHFGIDRTVPSSAINPLNPTTFETGPGRMDWWDR
jgi:hypothetical protein